MLENWSVTYTDPVSTFLFLLGSTFTRASLERKLNAAVAKSGMELHSFQHLKASTRPGSWFRPAIPFPMDETLQTSRYSIARKCSNEIHSLVSSLSFTAKTRHVAYTAGEPPSIRSYFMNEQ